MVSKTTSRMILGVGLGVGVVVASMDVWIVALNTKIKGFTL
jgi:hypothetical protein